MSKEYKISSVYLIGIGGIGMSALAKYYRQNGLVVAGYDRTQSPITDMLDEIGIDVHFNDDVNSIPSEFTAGKEGKLVIFTPAVPKDHAELNFLKNQGHKVIKRSEALGNISASHRTIAVAGTHGKTTTSSILAHILKQSKLDCTAFLGGMSTNYNSNFLSSTSSPLMVVEADEYDRSFLKLSPEMAIVTSMDPDHLDIYGDAEELNRSFEEFASNLGINGTLIFKKGLPLKNGLYKKLTYSINESADYHVKDYAITDGRFSFDLNSPFGKMTNVDFGMPGIHNMENAVAAIAASHQLGVSEIELREALASYKGVTRRFELILNDNGVTFIDDYAHHPTELDACISSVKKMYPNKKLTGVFQPHLFTRTRDNMSEFARSLSELDQLYLLDIYPARELPIEGVTSQVLLDQIQLNQKTLISKGDVTQKLVADRPEVLLTLGAGDIDRLIQPIKNALTA
jgi:UDP-N-acetylmuramate--alanine ligase